MLLVLYFEILKEVDQFALVRLEVHLCGKLVHTKFFYDLENVKLFVELLACIVVEEVFALSLYPQTEAALLVEFVKTTVASIAVLKALT